MSTDRPSSPSVKRSSPPFWQTLSFNQWMIIIGIILIIVVPIAFVLLASDDETFNVNVSGVQSFPNLSAGHVEGTVQYDQNPPAGGPHHPAWQTCAVYTAPIANEHAVHSLEHGAVWITYRPDLDESEVSKLAGITRQSTHRMLSPYPGLPSPIVASAWGYQLRLQSADDERLMDFIRQYEQGPNTPEPGASCTGGQTRTLAELGR